MALGTNLKKEKLIPDGTRGSEKAKMIDPKETMEQELQTSEGMFGFTREEVDGASQREGTGGGI